MTLQVGLVGSDGIVLASDRLVSSLAFDGNVTRTKSSKFFRNQDVVCCWSGDRTAELAANLIHELSWADRSRRNGQMAECAATAWRKCHGSGSSVPRNLMRGVGKILVAFSDCTLWEMEIFDSNNVAQAVCDKTVAGDRQTTIRHLLNNYIPREAQPITRLIGIAAHMISMGHRENNAGIDGLEVAIIKPGDPPMLLTSEQELELLRISESAHATIEELLLKPFDYQAPSH